MDWWGSSLISHIAWLHRARSTPEKLCQGLNDITIIISGLMSCNIGCGTVIAGFTGNGDRKVSYRCIHWRLDQAQITIQSRAFGGKWVGPTIKIKHFLLRALFEKLWWQITATSNRKERKWKLETAEQPEGEPGRQLAACWFAGCGSNGNSVKCLEAIWLPMDWSNLINHHPGWLLRPAWLTIHFSIWYHPKQFLKPTKSTANLKILSWQDSKS